MPLKKYAMNAKRANQTATSSCLASMNIVIDKITVVTLTSGAEKIAIHTKFIDLEKVHTRAKYVVCNA